MVERKKSDIDNIYWMGSSSSCNYFHTGYACDDLANVLIARALLLLNKQFQNQVLANYAIQGGPVGFTGKL